MLEWIHVSGVGVVGSFLLWELDQLGVEFSWDDVESPLNAWEVSTGGILPYPDGDPSPYAAAYRFWRDDVALRPVLAPYLEPVRVLHALKSRSARSRAEQWALLAEAPRGVRLWQEPTTGWQLNVQEFVVFTRRHFQARRVQPTEVTDVPGYRVTQVWCRGVGDPRARPVPVWGWQLAVELTPTASSPLWAGAHRFALHFSDPVSSLTRLYLQPVATVGHLWWAGTDKRLQRQPQREDARAEAQVARFKQVVTDLFGGWLEATYHTHIGQGWRPQARSAPWRGVACVEVNAKLLIAAPLGRNGVQRGPLVARDIAALLCA